jgi:hypothetical protein
MSHNKITSGGTLQPLADLLSRSKISGDGLTGQEVVINDKRVRVILAVDADAGIHLLISPVSGDSSVLSKLGLKGLSVVTKEWAVAGLPVQQYLDISCMTGATPSFKRPFLKFAEDVLYEMDTFRSVPAEAVRRTCLRWQRFWSENVSDEVTKEWLHGIFGELLFLRELIERFGGVAVNKWTGPSGADHDFQTGTDLAVEVKTSSETPFMIHCNIRQLDTDLFNKLYIVCYKLTPADGGTTLSDLVQEIESKLADDSDNLDQFYGRLAAAGYRRQLEPRYDESILSASPAAVFTVDDEFPKITEKSFIASPDHRITGIRYSLQLSGISELSIGDIANELSSFKD